MYLNINLHFDVENYLNTAYNASLNTVNLGVQKLSDYTFSIVEHFFLSVVAYVLLCFVLYSLVNRGYGLKFQKPFRKPKRVLVVTAHPDDECMFFGPAIYKLVRETKCSIYLVCLSTGNKDGLGKKRKRELFNSCSVLGINESNIFVHNCTVLPDDPSVRWREDVVAQIISNHVETLNIDTLLTFDKHGVSRHSNHCSVYYAVAYLTMEKKLPEYCKVYTLDSINLLRKYWLIFDIPISFVFSTQRYILQWTERKLIIDAMKQHVSQYVWFRKLYVIFSRYMIINTFQQLDMIDLELDLALDD